MQLNREFTISNLTDRQLRALIPSARAKWHYLFYIRKGKGKLQIDIDTRHVGPMSIMLLERFKKWKWLEMNGIEGTLIRFTDQFYNYIYTGNPKIKSDQLLAGKTTPLIKLTANQRWQWESLIKIIESELVEEDDNVAEIVCLLLKTLVVLYQRNTTYEQKFFIYRRKEQIVFDFIMLINQQYKEFKNPVDYAKQLNITANYLNSICKKNYNKTAGQLIVERVILEAKRLLTHTPQSASEIAYNLGFKDNSYFTRYFRKATGITPIVFRLTNTFELPKE